jgi:hypothetical protein
MRAVEQGGHEEERYGGRFHAEHDGRATTQAGMYICIARTSVIV